MLTRTSIALALVLATASGALAAPKRYNTNTNQSQGVYDIRGHHVGSDPDATVRSQIAHDPTQGD